MKITELLEIENQYNIAEKRYIEAEKEFIEIRSKLRKAERDYIQEIIENKGE